MGEHAAPKQYKFNHDDCPAGIDTKQRLYIKVPYDQPWTRVAYCHNCGQSGFAQLRKDNATYLSQAGVLTPESTMSTVASTADHILAVGKGQHTYMAMDIEFDPDKWPIQATLLLANASIPNEVAVRYNIGYQASSQRMVYQYVDEDDNNKVRSQQFRAIYPYQTPKYFSWDSTEAEYTTDVISPMPELRKLDALVITEDLLSAIRVVEDVGCSALPIRGVHYNAEQLYDVTHREDIKEVYVWLDNDSDTVRTKAQRIVETIEMLSDVACHKVDYPNDPKNISHIEDVLDRYKKGGY